MTFWLLEAYLHIQLSLNNKSNTEYALLYLLFFLWQATLIYRLESLSYIAITKVSISILLWSI